MKIKKIIELFKLKYFVISFIFIGLLSIWGVFASVNYLGSELKTNYTAGETISGKININIANHPGNSIFTSNFPGNITLLELIKAQTGLIEGKNYTCSAEGCVNDYVSTGSISQIQLSSGNNYYAGFKIDGPGIVITDAKIIINSNAPASCTPNLYVDLLSDNQNILTSNLNSGESCGIKHVGCYDSLNVVESIMVTGKDYCEKISIPATPSFILGGKIRKGDGNSNLTMKLYDYDTTKLLESCKLPQNSQDLEELKCVVNYSSSEVKEYYVCISTSLNNNYKIGAETSLPNCGTAQGFGSLNSDVDLFAETMKYASNPSFTINQSTYLKYNGNDLSNTLENYLYNEHNSDCQLSSCFIPIQIYGTNQLVSFGNSEINYESVGYNRNAQQIYGLSFEPSKISASNISLEVSKANFVIPVDSTDNSFKLYVDGNKLFDKSINLKKSFLFDINPKLVSFGQNTKFTATTDKANITKTVWNFGDGTSTQTIDGNSVFHAFTNANSSFDVNVTAFINQTQATRQFKVFVGSPKEIANYTIFEYKRRLLNITKKIDTYPLWASQKIKDNLMINNITYELNSIEFFYKNASTEEDYRNIMLDLIDLDVPVEVITSVSGENLPLGIGFDNINVNYIEQIDNKDVVDNDALKNKILGWMDSNFNPYISFSKIERIGDYKRDPIMSIFTIRTNPVGSVSDKAYLILGQDISNSGLYKSNYNHVTLTSGVDYIILDNSISQTFEFLIEGDIDAQILGAYISPPLDSLGNVDAPSGECNLNNICDSGENSKTCPEDCSNNWFKFSIIGWVILLVVTFVIYLFLQEWYKRNYQNSLFPESNDLYNLVNFIYNARKSGLSDSEIKSKLKAQRWSGERIGFAFRKIDGKRIGMFEIPIFKWREHKEVVNQIANRQPQGVVNARFIKRPY